MKKRSRVSGLIALTMIFALLVGLMPVIAVADYTEYSPGTMWPSSQRTFPRDVTVVNCDRLIIRQYADFSAREILSATRGRHFTATGMVGNFIQLRMDDGSVGYGYASYLQPGAEMSGAVGYNSPYLGRIYNTPGYGYYTYPWWRIITTRPDPRPHPPRPVRPPRPDQKPIPNPLPPMP